MRTLVTVIAIAASVAAPLTARQGQPSSAMVDRFQGVDVRFVHPNERKMEIDSGELVIDTQARRVTIKSRGHSLDAAIDDVKRVTVEINTFGKKAGFGASFLGMFAGGILFGDSIATSISKPFDEAHFVLFDYTKPGGAAGQSLVSVERQDVPRLLKALGAAFGDRLLLPVFKEQGDKQPRPKTRPTVAFTDRPTDKQHPLPEVRADRALVVVVTPAGIMRRLSPDRRGGGTYILANGEPVALSGPGTYTYFYLPPGAYVIASLTSEVVGLKMQLDAGQAYYLGHTEYASGMRLKSFLRRHSPELVMYEVAGSLWSDPTPVPAK